LWSGIIAQVFLNDDEIVMPIPDEPVTNLNRPVVLDLFSGAGGMSLGFEAAGFDIGASVEIDPIHCAVHDFNFPYTATLCKSIVDITTDEIEHELLKKGFNHIDVIVGGPPCQGFSQIGLRQLDDPRNSLVFEYLRLVKQIKPKYFVFENVKGIVLGEHKMFVEELIEEFNKIGYNTITPYRVLNAADYGVAQNRYRFILIGIRNDQKAIEYPHPSHTAAKQGQIGLFSMPHVGSREAIGNLEGFDVFIGDDIGLPYNVVNYNGYSEKYRYDPASDFSLCHHRSHSKKVIYGHSGARHTLDSQRRFLETRCGDTETISRFFKLHPNRPSNTLRAGTDSKRGAYTAARPIHYSLPRCISIREGARLHSFPDWFQFHLTIWHGFRQLGNSVAPLFAKEIGTQIMKGLGIDTSKLNRYILPQTDEHLIRINMSTACKYFGISEDVIGKRNKRERIS
jgi:DNA (cytosine-5)-methyltransferase 1